MAVKEAEVKAKDILVGARADAEREVRERRKELTALETKIESREETLEKRLEAFERREADLNRRDQSVRTREKNIAEKEAQHQALIDEARAKLEEVANLTREEAKRALIEEMTGPARTEAAKHIRVIEEEAREEADRRAKRIVSIAIERLAGEFVTERTVAVIPLPNDEMKGRIIGREGRNIRAIEAATGVDIIIDDTPESVVISCHNPIRREIARVASGAADFRRPHSSRAHRGSHPQGRAGSRGIHQRGRPARDHRIRRARRPSRAGQAARDAQVSLQLRAERADAFDRGGVHLRRDGGRAWGSTKSRRGARRCCTTSARRSRMRSKDRMR